ncbi:50S ribosomal protein L7/L12 [Reticulibacter mediterranei]|uniref:Large ribosomal subunit protein bL12 n=1 Tax=Reticulibacter mediterranei TaxID=2778369 RepID=A0A8J3N0Q5_9CHLR|nr:50S ribosomal protein L7/L12 [Reticulibacter mediterranei]GHO93172.1 50S ribosomal protein L7/L12 [Reticulibacter mediterranei]
MSVASIIEEIGKLNVLELVELSKKLQEEWGVSAAPVAVAGAAAAAAPAEQAAAAPIEEQTEFDAVLTEVGPNKINVIKVVRELTGLGLKEAKAVVDEAPKAVKEAVSKDEAEKIAAKLAEVGAKVTVK